MKRFFISLFISLVIIHCDTYSQDGWFWLNPLPQGNWLTDVEFTANNNIYVSGYGGTMMKSTDGGNSFNEMGNRECGRQIVFINDLTGFSNSVNGILKTTNGGNNWRYISAPVDTVNDFSTDPQIKLYGIKNNKVYISSNIGESWELSLTALPNNILYSLHFPTNNIGFVVGYKPELFHNSRMHKTTNGGISWDTIPVNFRYRTKDVYFLNEQTGFVNISFGRDLLLKTINSGVSWDTVYNNFIPTSLVKLKFFDLNTGYVRLNSDILYTTNQGSNWTYSITSKNTFLENINNGIGLSNNFFSRTTNRGINWISLSSGFDDDFYDVTFINDNTGFTGGNNYFYKTTNSGLNWSSYNLGLTYYNGVNTIMFMNENTGYAGIDGGKFAKTTNCGLNWKIIQTITNDHLYGMSFPSMDTGYAITKWGITIKTTNAGVNWSLQESESLREFEDIIFVNNLTGFSGGIDYDSNKAIIRKTENGGSNWTNILLDSIEFARDLCLTSDNHLFAVGYSQNDNIRRGGIYRTTDFGDTWLGHIFPNAISSVYFSSGLTGYASAENNIVYKTTNAGENWFSTYCPNYFDSWGLYFTNDLTGYAVSPVGQIIKTTTGGGVLISVEPISYVVPHKFNLYQNYPNPFNPVTKIKFDIPKAMNATLKIYDILGREVRVIVNDFLIPGTYAFDFDGSNLPSGVYFYVLKGTDFSESKKMILIK